MILMPDVPQLALNTPTSYVQVSSTSSVAPQRAIGICDPVLRRLADSDQGTGPLSPQGWYEQYFYSFDKGELPHRDFIPTIEIITAPKHGVIKERGVTNPEEHEKITEYVPAVGFKGEDKVVFNVTYQGKSVSVLYLFRVGDVQPGSSQDSELACPDHLAPWKISSSENQTPTTTLFNSALGAFKGFTDLPAGEVGSGINASISLDINAAGNGWYQTANPFDNSDFLPTADANIWVTTLKEI